MKHLTTLSLITAFATAMLIIVSFCCIMYTNSETMMVNQKEGAAFWAKVFFSATFMLAALFVILSKRYDDETKKWAFSVLTLIAGVWIGTVTS